jgi:hypothetical protein
MIKKLNKELIAALQASGDDVLEVVDPETLRVYVVVDANVHREAMEALRSQQDRQAIEQGLAELEAGSGMSIDESRRLTRERLLARER